MVFDGVDGAEASPVDGLVVLVLFKDLVLSVHLVLRVGLVGEEALVLFLGPVGHLVVAERVGGLN